MPNPHPFADRWNHNTRHYPRIRQLLEPFPVVLDVGCGEGTLARYLAEQGHRVIGVDSDPTILPADVPGAHFMLGDAAGLPFDTAQFDAVVAVMVLHHTAPELALVEMRRVLKPGGLLVVLGYAKDSGPGDLVRSIGDAVENLWAKRGTTAWDPPTAKAGARLGWARTRELMVEMLPGASWQRLPGWRYLTTWHQGGNGTDQQ